jgi:hypothetical protein
MTIPGTEHRNEPTLACSARAFTPDERARWTALGSRVVRHAVVRRELPNGYVCELERTPEALRALVEFVELESRCCPFLDLAIRLPAGGRLVVFELTGREGVKAILAGELDFESAPREASRASREGPPKKS